MLFGISVSLNEVIPIPSPCFLVCRYPDTETVLRIAVFSVRCDCGIYHCQPIAM